MQCQLIQDAPSICNVFTHFLNLPVFVVAARRHMTICGCESFSGDFDYHGCKPATGDSSAAAADDEDGSAADDDDDGNGGGDDDESF